MSPTSSALAQRNQFYTTSSIADFVHIASTSPTQYSPVHKHKTGRKTWKSLKEKKEAVWPDFLEEALLEALERYRPTSSKDPRLLRRFPKRNAFISCYIKNKTGAQRTPKQVGSRLQQLRETCTEERVIRLICSRDFDSPDRLGASQACPTVPTRVLPDLRINTAIAAPSSPSSGTASGVTPSLSIDSLTLVDPYDYPVTPLNYADEFDRRSPLATVHTSWPHAYVHIDLMASGDYYASTGRDSPTSFTLDLDESGLTDSPVLTGPDAWKWQRRISVSTALPACYYTPSVTVSSSLLASNGRYECVYRVQKDHKLLFEESTDLEPVSEATARPSLFRTTLLPKYWGSVASRISELRQCVVIQDIYELTVSSERSRDPLYSIIYNFDGSFPVEQSDSTYYAAPYHTSPVVHDERIPLAPIFTNSACSPELLNYDYDTGDINLLPTLSVGEIQTPTTQWISPMYISNSYYPANSYAIGHEQSVGTTLDSDQLAYPTLYPF
ncbi:hypothetical protein FA15DRAFT_745860 [Coprinopsis marcescibilis]|uniref:TEA domain-containing protein n=1 Tax=Coprinopsis marcescibilis TaxID=230819 RepID=A0A5C3KSM0_COPMA|nr:hypothetical protein FA15DRAFT_745860 [Coprinopsis marcescibilis]